MTEELKLMRQRTGTASQWLANDIVLLLGEIGMLITDDNSMKMKVGNGIDKFSLLPFLNSKELSEKQNILISGTNLKTINNESLLGSGNLDVGGGGTIPTKLSQLEKDIDFDDRYFTEQETTNFLSAKENSLPATPSLPLTKYLNGNKEWAIISGFALTDHNHNTIYEPIIAIKNTAFNKNFGTTTDTICAGDDTRLSDTRNPTAHEQAISTITGLQDSLEAKMAKQIVVDNGSVLPTNLTTADIFIISATTNLSFGTLTIPSNRSAKQFEITNVSASSIVIAIPTTTAHRREVDSVTIPANKMRTITVDYDGTTYNWYMSAELKNA